MPNALWNMTLAVPDEEPIARRGMPHETVVEMLKSLPFDADVDGRGPGATVRTIRGLRDPSLDITVRAA
jgi:hypothetical protein